MQLSRKSGEGAKQAEAADPREGRLAGFKRCHRLLQADDRFTDLRVTDLRPALGQINRTTLLLGLDHVDPYRAGAQDGLRPADGVERTVEPSNGIARRSGRMALSLMIWCRRVCLR